MARTRLTALLLLSVAFADRTAAAQSVKGTCFPVDQMSARVLRYFQGVVTPTDPQQTKLRTDLLLTSVTAAQVTLVTDDKICAKAAKAMDKLADTKKQEYQLYVVQVGDAFGVVDPTWDAGEWKPAILFDRNWKMRRILLAF
jgi:hypothetical protein